MGYDIYFTAVPSVVADVSAVFPAYDDNGDRRAVSEVLSVWEGLPRSSRLNRAVIAISGAAMTDNGCAFRMTGYKFAKAIADAGLLVESAFYQNLFRACVKAKHKRIRGYIV